MRWALATILIVTTGTFVSATYHRRACLSLERIERDNAEANREMIATMRTISANQAMVGKHEQRLDRQDAKIEHVEALTNANRNDVRKLETERAK